MSRNGNGQYTLPAGNPVVPGTTITTDWANNTLQDIATALTGSVAADGQTPMSGNLDMSNNKIVGLTNGTNPQDAATVNQIANPTITGGTINGAVIGATNPKNGTFENLTATVSATVPTLPLTDSSTKAANTKFVQDLVAQGGGGGGGATILMAFGVSKVPADLPANGVIPANWDSPGNPKNTITFKVGEGAIFNLANPSTPNYNDVFVYSPINLGWIDVGPIEGPPGPQGPAGPQGIQGNPGPQGVQGVPGVKGDTGADGPQGVKGDAGPQGIQGVPGPQGAAGQSVIIVGAFGASKTPADLPPNGLIPANWDSTGNPPVNEQLVIGEGLIYNLVAPTDPLYGNVYSFVGVGFDADGWINVGKIQGPKGDTGAPGPQGIQGVPGNNGTDGQQGLQGPQGVPGVKGDTGAQGPQGPQGAPGTGITDNAVTFAASAGDAPGATFDGSVARQVGYATVGAPSTNGTGATGNWPINITGVAQGGANITSQQVTTALGFTPYNSTNPAGYVTLAAVQAQGYTTLATVQQQGYITSSALTNYVTLNSAQTISGAKTFSAAITAPYFTATSTTTASTFAQPVSVNFAGSKATITNNGIELGATGVGMAFFSNAINTITNGGANWIVQKGSNTVNASGAAAKPGGGAWADSSDIRLKSDVQTLTNCLDTITQLNPVQFLWKTPNDAAPSVGFIADEVEQVIPTAVIEITLNESLNPATNLPLFPDQYDQAQALRLEESIPADQPVKVKAIGWKNDFFAMLVGSIQDLNNKIEAQQAEITALKAK